MLDADHLRIVFQVNGTGFVMPVEQLLAIRNPGEDDLCVREGSSSTHVQGRITYQEIEVPTHDLSALFSLPGRCAEGDGQLLIFSGSDGPWAVTVDQVCGIVDIAGFEFQDLPAYMFSDGDVPYHQVAEYEGQLLVSTDARQIDQAWRRVQ